MKIKFDHHKVINAELQHNIVKSEKWYEIDRNNVPFLPATACQIYIRKLIGQKSRNVE